MPEKKQGLLKAAFEGTDTITYGPFSITKKPGAHWGQARVVVGGKTVTMGSMEKRFLALLVSQRGDALPLPTLALETKDSFPSSRYLRIMSAENRDIEEEARALEDIANLVRVMACKIRAGLFKQGVDKDAIASILSPRTRGQGRVAPEQKAAYRIGLPKQLRFNFNN